MKFYNYLNEEKDENKIQKFLIECDDYLKNINLQKLVYSGRNRTYNIGRENVRKRRIPKDTPLFLHNELDNAFKKDFGVKARTKGIFVTKSLYTAESYGQNVYYVFPTGNNYKFIYSEEISDLYIKLKSKIRQSIPQTHEYYFDISDKYGRFFRNFDKKKHKGIYKTVKAVIEDIIGTYEETKSPASTSTLNELMLIADSVWMLKKNHYGSPPDFIEKIKEMQRG